jgi:hypothetical protein
MDAHPLRECCGQADRTDPRVCVAGMVAQLSMHCQRAWWVSAAHAVIRWR